MKPARVLAAIVLAMVGYGPARAQGLAEYPVYVAFDSIEQQFTFFDNTLPAVTGVSRNGTLHVSFEAVQPPGFPVTVPLTNVTGTVTGPAGATVEVGLRGDAVQSNFRDLFVEAQATAVPTPLFSTGNFFVSTGNGLLRCDVFLTFPTPGMYAIQLQLTGQSAIDPTVLTTTTVSTVVTVAAEARAPTSTAVFWGPWDVARHYAPGAIVTTGPLIQDANFNTFPDPAQLDYWISVLPGDNFASDPTAAASDGYAHWYHLSSSAGTAGPMGPMGPPGPAGPAGPQGIPGPIITSSALVVTPTTAVPPGYTFRGYILLTSKPNGGGQSSSFAVYTKN